MTASSRSHTALMRWKKADLAEEVLALRRELDASHEGTEPIDAAVADALPAATSDAKKHVDLTINAEMQKRLNILMGKLFDQLASFVTSYDSATNRVT